uniref:Bm11848 n=1 Tax=Brugia malayi TaxID=6279 RepID=A0A1I9G9V9_BRUMA|nr:Bm11848 [Brugia malayi]
MARLPLEFSGVSHTALTPNGSQDALSLLGGQLEKVNSLLSIPVLEQSPYLVSGEALWRPMVNDLDPPWPTLLVFLRACIIQHRKSYRGARAVTSGAQRLHMRESATLLPALRGAYTKKCKHGLEAGGQPEINKPLVLQLWRRPGPHSVVEHVASMPKALGSVSSTTINKATTKENPL